jgi:alanine transaminase
MVTPPQPGDESYEQFAAEESSIMKRLKTNAIALVDGLNAVDGIDCVRAEGAMYAFPRLQLPAKAIEEAEHQEVTPDTLYALSLLEETGICVVPASGFGQEEGRVGFRTTFLPAEDKIANAIGEIKRHHELFCQKYS